MAALQLSQLWTGQQRFLSFPDSDFIRQPVRLLTPPLLNICCTVRVLEASPGQRENAG